MFIFVVCQTFINSFIQGRMDRSERGAAMVEYALLVALIAIVSVVVLTTLGGSVKDKFSTVSSCLSTTTSCP
ncbi:MAG: Flp family type IVb pilin [Acidimicrobiales bacterium]